MMRPTHYRPVVAIFDWGPDNPLRAVVDLVDRGQHLEQGTRNIAESLKRCEVRA
jgi:hypothetical protein